MACSGCGKKDVAKVARASATTLPEDPDFTASLEERYPQVVEAPRLPPRHIVTARSPRRPRGVDN